VARSLTELSAGVRIESSNAIIAITTKSSINVKPFLLLPAIINTPKLNLKRLYSSDFNTTSFNWWMETTAEGGRAAPEYGNATGIYNEYTLNNTTCKRHIAQQNHHLTQKRGCLL
jgi:hypothetical protein